MALFSPLMSFTEKMLDVTTIRHRTISNNLANINTSGFKRSEVSFSDALERIKEAEANEATDLNEELKTRSIDSQILENLSVESLYHDGQKYTSDLGVNFALAEASFMQGFKTHAAGLPGDDLSPRGSTQKATTREDIIASVQPKIEEAGGAMRTDGNNVSPEAEVGKMIQNTSFYNVLVSSISGEFRTLKTIISNR